MGGRFTLLWQDIQKSIGTTQAAVVCVGACIYACAHMCVLMLEQTGRQGETSALDPRAVLRVRMPKSLQRAGGRVEMGCGSPRCRKAPRNICSAS